jgi:hypothetical protein
MKLNGLTYAMVITSFFGCGGERLRKVPPLYATPVPNGDLDTGERVVFGEPEPPASSLAPRDPDPPEPALVPNQTPPMAPPPIIDAAQEDPPEPLPEPLPDRCPAHSVEDGACGIITTPLYAGRTREVGSVTLSLKDGELHIQVWLFDDWRLETWHIYLSDDSPVTNAPGQFTYTPPPSLEPSCELVVSQPSSETALYVGVHVDLAHPREDGRVERDGAWAYGDVPFSELPLGNSRWGWWLSYPTCEEEVETEEPVEPEWPSEPSEPSEPLEPAP